LFAIAFSYAAAQKAKSQQPLFPRFSLRKRYLAQLKIASRLSGLQRIALDQNKNTNLGIIAAK